MSKNDSTVQKADAISLDDEEGVKQVLVNSVLGLWDVVNNLTRLKPSKHERYRVTIFGSARVKPGTFGYEETKRAAAALAAMGCDIITGGGPGIDASCQRRSRGRASSRPIPRHSRRFTIRTGSQCVRDPGVRAPHFFYTPAPVRADLRRFHRRARWHRHGARNHDDLAALTSPSSRKHAAYSRRENVAIEWARASMLSTEPSLANAADMAIPRCVVNADEAIAVIREYHQLWLSGCDR